MECEDAEQESESAKIVSDPDSQEGENKKNMRQLTCNSGVGALRA